jgi:hypothetical protein
LPTAFAAGTVPLSVSMFYGCMPADLAVLLLVPLCRTRRYYKASDGLSLDVGPFTAALVSTSFTVTVTVTVFGTAEPCNPEGSQRLMGLIQFTVQTGQPGRVTCTCCCEVGRIYYYYYYYY